MIKPSSRKAFGQNSSLRDAFLGPVQVPFDLFGGFHPVGKIGASAVEPPLSERLQFKELSMLGVELAGTGLDQRAIRYPNSLDIRDSRLCLPGQTSVQRQWIDRVAETVVQHLDQIHTGSSAM